MRQTIIAEKQEEETKFHLTLEKIVAWFMESKTSTEQELALMQQIEKLQNSLI